MRRPERPPRTLEPLRDSSFAKSYASSFGSFVPRPSIFPRLQVVLLAFGVQSSGSDRREQRGGCRSACRRSGESHCYLGHPIPVESCVGHQVRGTPCIFEGRSKNDIDISNQLFFTPIPPLSFGLSPWQSGHGTIGSSAFRPPGRRDPTHVRYNILQSITECQWVCPRQEVIDEVEGPFGGLGPKFRVTPVSGKGAASPRKRRMNRAGGLRGWPRKGFTE